MLITSASVLPPSDPTPLSTTGVIRNIPLRHLHPVEQRTWFFLAAQHTYVTTTVANGEIKTSPYDWSSLLKNSCKQLLRSHLVYQLSTTSARGASRKIQNLAPETYMPSIRYFHRKSFKPRTSTTSTIIFTCMISHRPRQRFSIKPAHEALLAATLTTIIILAHLDVPEREGFNHLTQIGWLPKFRQGAQGFVLQWARSQRDVQVPFRELG